MQVAVPKAHMRRRMHAVPNPYTSHAPRKCCSPVTCRVVPSCTLAHAGVAGILYVLLHHTGTIRQLDTEARSGAGSRGSSSVGGYMAAVTGAVDALAAAVLPSGNLPTKLGDREDV